MKCFKPLFFIFFIFLNAKAQKDTLRINQLQVIGSHNSYKKAIEPALYMFLEKKDSTKSIQSLQYDHVPILEQLDLGLRNLEIDVYADSEGGKYANPKGLEFVKPIEVYDPDKKMLKPGFKILHVLDIDFRTYYYTLEACLKDLKTWSDAHLAHEPIFITLEVKDGYKSHFGTEPEKFTDSIFNQLDDLIVSVLGKDKIIEPDDVRGDFSTLEAAVLSNNWPKLEGARGTFLFILDDSGLRRDLYIKNHPSLQDRIMFVNANPGTPEAGTMILNNPEDESIPKLVKQGYIIRTRADSNTKEARTNDYSSFEAAKKSGAQIITTDYYLPSQFFESAYKISFENGTYVRINPVTAE